MANWEKKFIEAEKEGKRVPKDWRKMIELIKKIHRDGENPWETSPVPHSHPQVYTRETPHKITLEDIPTVPISDDEGMEEYIKDANSELQELCKKEGKPKDKSTPSKYTWTSKEKSEYEQISQSENEDPMEFGELRNPLEHRPSQSHSNLGRSTSAESESEE